MQIAGDRRLVDNPLGRASDDWPSWPRVDLTAAMQSFETILRGRVWTVRAPGPQRSRTEVAEEAFAAFAGAPYALLVASGTVAVELAVRAIAPPQGAKVIVPALGWFATAAAVMRAGATPVFADIDPLTSCIDPNAVAALIDPDVIAVVAVHLHCSLADIDALSAICEQHSITLIEDCAQAHGSEYAGRPIGTIGAMGCFSLNQEKMIAVGEGGCIITSDPALQRRIHALRTDGYLRSNETNRVYLPQNEVLGGNACMNEFAAALVEVQLADFAAQDRQRRAVAQRLEAEIMAIDGVMPLASALATTRRSYHEFAFTLDPHVFGDNPVEEHGDTLTLALGFPIHPTDEPTQECPMMALDDEGVPAPQANSLHERLLVFHHRILLDERIVAKLPQALRVLQADQRKQGVSGGSSQITKER